MRVRTRIAELERRAVSAPCVVCEHRQLPFVDAIGRDPYGPEVEREVQRVKLRPCDVCGWRPRISVVIVSVLPSRGDAA